MSPVLVLLWGCPDKVQPFNTSEYVALNKKTTEEEIQPAFRGLGNPHQTEKKRVGRYCASND